MLFDEKLKIFQYHFPKIPILPGALLIDFVLNEILEKSGFFVSIRFVQPIYPNQEVEFAIELKESDIHIKVFNQQCIYAKLKLKSDNMIKSTIDTMKDLNRCSNRIEKYKPMSNSSREITFLDQWYILNKNDDMTVVGEYYYQSNTLDCISDFKQVMGLGQDFLLIEFMSLTVLSSLAKEKMIDLQDNYGFARINQYKRYCTVCVGDWLTTVVHCNLTGNGIIWNGYVLRDDCLIAEIGQGIDLPLKRKDD